MTRSEWMKELSGYLSALGDDERERAMSYYAELYNDKRDNGMPEREILRGFGSPREAADMILSHTTEEDRLTATHSEQSEPAPDYEEPTTGEHAPADVRPPGKKKSVFLRIVLPVIIAVVIALAVYSAVATIIDSATRSTQTYDITEPADVLVIEAASAEVTVVQGDALSVVYDTSAFVPVNITETDNGGRKVLSIEQRHLAFIAWSMLDAEITVTVPSLTDISVESAAGSVRVAGFDLGELSIDSSAGSVIVADCTASDIDIDSAAGDVMLRNVSAGSLSVDSAAGGAELANVTADSVGLEFAAGSVTLDRLTVGKSLYAEFSAGSLTGTMVGREEDYSVSVEASAGTSNLANADRGTGKSITAEFAAGSLNITFIE